jgi:hypothetical protein
MADTNLTQFDFNGNIISDFPGIVGDTGGLTDNPYGIETDGVYLYIVIDQSLVTGFSTVYQFTKKGGLIRVFNPPVSSTYGITFNGKDLIFSDVTPAYRILDRAGTEVSNAAASSTFIALTHNGKSIIAAAPGLGNNLTVVNAKDFTVEKTIPISITPLGVCDFGGRLAVIDQSSINLYYYNYDGTQTHPAIALDVPGGTRGYRDLCHDGLNFWATSFAITDVGEGDGDGG